MVNECDSGASRCFKLHDTSVNKHEVKKTVYCATENQPNLF